MNGGVTESPLRCQQSFAYQGGQRGPDLIPVIAQSRPDVSRRFPATRRSTILPFPRPPTYVPQHSDFKARQAAGYAHVVGPLETGVEIGPVAELGGDSTGAAATMSAIGRSTPSGRLSWEPALLSTIVERVTLVVVIRVYPSKGCPGTAADLPSAAFLCVRQPVGLVRLRLRLGWVCQGLPGALPNPVLQGLRIPPEGLSNAPECWGKTAAFLQPVDGGHGDTEAIRHFTDSQGFSRGRVSRHTKNPFADRWASRPPSTYPPKGSRFYASRATVLPWLAHAISRFEITSSCCCHRGTWPNAP